MKTLVNRLIILAVLTVLALPVGLQLAGWGISDEVDSRENRRLASAPTWDGREPAQFFAALTAYVNDRFALRHELINMANRWRFALGMEPNERGLIGRDSFLFLTRKNLVQQARGADPLTRTETQRLIKRWDALQTYWADRDITWVHLLAPGKSSALTSQLPGRVHIIDLPRARRYQDALSAAGIRSVDAFAAMTSPKEQYYRTDSHWNCLAALAVYKETMRLIEPGFDGSLVTLATGSIPIGTERRAGDIARTLFGLSESVADEAAPRCDYPALESSRVDYESRRSIKPRSGRHPYDQLQTVEVISPAALNPLRLAVVRDSFSWELEPLLNRTFQNVLYLYHWGLEPHTELIESFAPDVVIYQYTDRALHDVVEQWRSNASAATSAPSGE